jgi:hypothetical protein
MQLLMKSPQFLQFVQQKMSGQAMPSAQPTQQSGAVVPQVGGVQSGQGQPGAPQVGLSGSTPVPMQSSYQPRQPSETPQMEFATKQGRDAAGLWSISQELQKDVGRYEQKKATEAANKASIGAMLWWQAKSANDQQSMDAILEQYGDSFKKAYGKDAFPSYGKQKAQGAEQKQKPQPPPPPEAKGVLQGLKRAMMGGQKSQQQGPTNPQLPMPQATDAQKQAALVGGETTKQLSDPSILSNVVGSQLGQALTPVQQSQMQAEMQKVVMQTTAELMKVQNEIQGRMDVAQAEIAGKHEDVGVESKTKLSVAETEANARRYAADQALLGHLARASAYFKVGSIGNGVQALTDAVRDQISAATEARNKGQKEASDNYMKQADDLMNQLGTLSKGLGTMQGDAVLNVLGKQAGFGAKPK